VTGSKTRFYPDPQQGYSGAGWSSQHTESSMANTREYFASGVLKDGRVFAIGGEYSLTGGSWSSQYIESDMANTREYFASGVLKDGRVFAIGGEDSDAGSDTPLREIFDPQTNTWTAIAKPFPSFDFVRGDCNGSVLSDGRVLSRVSYAMSAFLYFV
jgi:Galactose oxidase, central domain